MPIASSATTTDRVYDDFTGTSLHPDRWVPLTMPLPDGSVRVCAEPTAREVVEDGTLNVTVERFETAHDAIQPADNVKYLQFSTEEFALPEQGRITFSVEQAATRSQTPFTHLIESPFAPVDVAPGTTHHLAVTIDTGRRTVSWTLDGHPIYTVTGAPLPERVQIGLGLLSCVRLRDQRSGSIKGQGVSARWARPTVTVHP